MLPPLKATILLKALGITLSAIVLNSGSIAPCRAASPLEPEQALADFLLPPGYRVELVACEPEVIDPIAIAFDEDGRMWVVEMGDYPLLEPGQAPNSRIRVLTDENGDGRYETATTFADALRFPTGIQPWRGGVIVTLHGEIIYLRDSTGDGQADQREVWYQGFSTGNEQLRANHPTLAHDGMVYVAGGLRGGKIHNPRQPDAPEINISGRDFAFDPVTGDARAVSGNGQYGLTFDEFGRRYTCSNRNPVIQVMIEQRYLERNPQLMLPKIVHDVAAAGAESRVYARSRALTTSANHAGQFTAACGVEIFLGNRLPQDAYGNVFVCEPTGSLVHREAMSSDGAAMTSTPVEVKAAFMSATDEWFRPVSLTTGPDGALYVVDMYRAVIEHPEWMPEEWRNRGDLRSGDDRGRIYRIVADSSESIALPISIASQSPAALVELLKHPNYWHRVTANRLLLERGDERLAPQLLDIALSESLADGRLRAMWLLKRLGKLDDSTLLSLLDDKVAGIREQALILAESRLAESQPLAELARNLMLDTDTRVRFQAVLSTMFLPAEQTVETLARVAKLDVFDPWTRRAVALASRNQANTILANYLRTVSAAETEFSVEVAEANAVHSGLLVGELSQAVVSVGGTQLAGEMLAIVPELEMKVVHSLIQAMAGALEERGDALRDAIGLIESQHVEASRRIELIFDEALETLARAGVDETARIEAAATLRHDVRPKATSSLLAVLQTETSPKVQAAIIDSLGVHDGPEISDLLLGEFEDYLPSVRRAVLELLISRPAWALSLLAAIEAEKVRLSDIDPTRIEKLRNHSDDEVKSRAHETLSAFPSPDRDEVMQEYRAALEMHGDLHRGRKLFLEHCATCHRVGEEGTAIGPDIGDAAMKPAAQLLSDILEPNRAIDANYVSYTAVTDSGKIYQGLIKSETDHGVVLLSADGKSITILKDELDILEAGQSLMPEGFERQISVEQMADLLSFLKNWRHEAYSTGKDHEPAIAIEFPSANSP